MFQRIDVLVGSCVAKTIVVVPAILTFYLFILQYVFNLSVLIEVVHPVESCTEGVAQEQERVARLLGEQ